MRKFLLAWLLAVPSFGAIALTVHTASAGAGGVSTFTTSAIDTTGSSLCVANISTYFGGVFSPSNITDAYSNTWSKLAYQGTPGAQSEFLLYAINPTVGAGHTFTVNSGRAGSVQIACFSGVTGVLPFDQSTGASGVSSTLQPGSLTPANNGSLLVTGAAVNAGITFSSINSGFTITDSTTAGGIIGGSLAYFVQTSAAAINPTWTFSGADTNNATMAVFIAGSDTPPASPALVSHITGSSNAGFTSSSINTTGATFCVANISSFAAAGAFSDSKSNTWTALTQRQSSSDQITERMYYAANPTVGSGHTFTVATGSSNNITMEVACFSGIANSIPFQSGAGLGSSNSSLYAANPGSVTPGTANSLIVSGMAVNVEAIYGIDTGFKATDITASSSIVGGALAYYVQAATTALNPTWSWGPAPNTWSMEIAVFSPTPPPSAFVSNPSIITVGP